MITTSRGLRRPGPAAASAGPPRGCAGVAARPSPAGRSHRPVIAGGWHSWQARPVEILRTPDDRFDGLPDFDYVPEYATVPDGEGGSLRMAYVEAGPSDGPVVLCLHGEPSWSFLYRRVMRVLADARLRVVVPDLVGFGRSDKPAEMTDHTYARHIEWTRALVFDALDLQDVTLVGQDWGGLIGLRLVTAHPDRFSRVIVANTGLPTGDFPMPETWLKFRQSVRTAPEFDIARNIAAGC